MIARWLRNAADSRGRRGVVRWNVLAASGGGGGGGEGEGRGCLAGGGGQRLHDMGGGKSDVRRHQAACCNAASLHAAVATLMP